MRRRNRVLLTLELFYEFNKGVIDPYYTIVREEDFVDSKGRTILSLHRLYMEMEDPSEYLFGTTYFDGYEHWKRIADSEYFRETITTWRKELALKIKAKAFSKLKAASENGNLDAAKFIVNADMSEGLPSNLKVPANKRGRPSTSPEKDTEFSKNQEKKMLMEDLKRITNVN